MMRDPDYVSAQKWEYYHVYPVIGKNTLSIALILAAELAAKYRISDTSNISIESFEGSKGSGVCVGVQTKWTEMEDNRNGCDDSE